MWDSATGNFQNGPIHKGRVGARGWGEGMDVLELDSSDGATTLNRLQTTLVGGPKRMLLTGAHRTCQALSVPSTITRQGLTVEPLVLKEA